MSQELTEQQQLIRKQYNIYLDTESRSYANLDTFLKDNYDSFSTVELAKMVGVNRGTISKVATQLGLSKRVDFIPQQGEELRELNPPNADYGITNFGRFVHIPTNTLRNVRKNRAGYLRCTIERNGIATDYLVHRLVAQAFVPREREEQTEVNHIDGVRDNPNASNLEWVTSKENNQHRIHVLGSHRVGSACNFASITEEQAKEIKRMIAKGCSPKEIRATLPYATKGIIDGIKGLNNWAHVKVDEGATTIEK